MTGSREVGESESRAEDEVDASSEFGEEQEELFTLRSGLRILLVLAVAFLLLSALCWVVGGPQQQ